MGTKPILQQILKLEEELAKMKIAMGMTPGRAGPNEWIKFTQRVNEALKGVEGKRPATVAKQFASHLKDIKSYNEWTDDEILDEFKSWNENLHGGNRRRTRRRHVRRARGSSRKN
jgi:predicted glycosyl hydrolase (DUF1957 family)